MIGRTDDQTIREALADCLKAAVDVDSFVQRLERHSLTILPLAVRRNAAMFGIGMVARMEDGSYDTLDPVSFKIETVQRET